MRDKVRQLGKVAVCCPADSKASWGLVCSNVYRDMPCQHRRQHYLQQLVLPCCPPPPPSLSLSLSLTPLFFVTHPQCVSYGIDYLAFRSCQSQQTFWK